jgi:hypothetical protein
MGIGRTILAVVVAVSVAMLPVAGGATLNTKSSEMSVSEPMHDCCPDHDKPCDRTIDDCTSMAACALKCCNFTGSFFSELVLPPIPASTVPVLVTGAVHSQSGSPPFRPPRV